jgi:hypothetical protein
MLLFILAKSSFYSVSYPRGSLLPGSAWLKRDKTKTREKKERRPSVGADLRMADIRGDGTKILRVNLIAGCSPARSVRVNKRERSWCCIYRFEARALVSLLLFISK